MDTQPVGPGTVSPLRAALRLLNLRHDQAAPEAIDEAIRANARAAGTNAWVLVAAIVIASIGLNVNSTAVIIGAMLISPLMGPIIGLGYGLGVHDRGLVRQSLKVLALFTAISLLSSTLYFLASPLTQAQSELLARTSPTIWDVLIAFVGGCAGMIGLTRKEKTTLIPGVAIATALMPPLCTAGYGIASGQMRFLAGALYLFTINGVFIALATLAITRMLRLPRRAEPEGRSRQWFRLGIAATVILTLVPSVLLAYQLVHEELFKLRVAAFVQQEVRPLEDAFLVASEIDARADTIALTLIGPGATPELERALAQRLPAHQLEGSVLRLLHPSERPAAPVHAPTESADLVTARAAAATAAEAATRHAARVAELEAELARERAAAAELLRVEAEVQALLPTKASVTVAWRSEDATASRAVEVVIDPVRRLGASDAARLRRWLRERLPGQDIRLVIGRAVPV